GAQNSLLKAVLTGVMRMSKRSTGFGLFYTCFGIAWFLGSATMGFLYDRSIIALVLLSVVLQLAALPVFFWGRARRFDANSRMFFDRSNACFHFGHPVVP